MPAPTSSRRGDQCHQDRCYPYGMGADGGAPTDEPLATDSRRPLAPVVFWGVVGAASCAAMAPLEPNLLEEGLIVHVTQRLLRGERLYSDVASFTGPLPFEFLALLFRLFGESIAVARGAVVALAGLACGSIYIVARGAGAGSLAHAAAALVASAPVFFFPLHSTYFYSTLAYDLTLITACVSLRGTRSVPWALAAGVLIAFVALCKQSVGAVLAIALVTALLGCSPRGRRLHTAIAVGVGGLAIAGLTSIYYAVHGEFGVLVESLAVMPLTFVDDFESAFINLWPPGRLAPEFAVYAHFYTPFVYSLLRGVVLEAPSREMILTTQLLYALPFLALLATALRRLRGPLPAAVWLHAAVLLALTSNLFPRTDWGHVIFAVAPAGVQLMLLAPGASARPSHRRAGLAALLILALAVGGFAVGKGLWGLASSAGLSAKVPQRPVSSATQNPELAHVIRYLLRRTTPGEAIFVARAEPLIYFATGTRNPTPYSGVIPGMLERQEAETVKGLEEVRFVVMSDIDQPTFTFYRDLLPGVQATLERHFRVAREFRGKRAGWIIVLERANDRGPAEIDLIAIRDRSRSWIRTEAGATAPPRTPAPRLATMQNRRPLPIQLGRGGGGVDFEIEVPADAVLQAEVGLAKIRGRNLPHPRHVEFSFWVGRNGSFERLATFPARRRSDDGNSWRPIEVDLAEYAGERLVLRIEVSPTFRLDQRSVAWLGSPRIATRSRPGRRRGRVEELK